MCCTKIIKHIFPLIFFITLLVQAQPQGRNEHHRIYSHKLEVKQNYSVYLPPGYDSSSTRYPVIYMFSYYSDYWFNNGIDDDFPLILDTLTHSGQIDGIIGVEVDIVNDDITVAALGVNMLRPDWCTSDLGNGRYEDYILRELIPHIDRRYRTVSNFQQRGTEGFSLTGYTSVMLPVVHPHMFRSVGVYDGTQMYTIIETDNFWMTDVWRDAAFDKPRNIAYMRLHNPTYIIYSADASDLNELKKIRFHMHAGDPQMPNTIYARMNHFNQRLASKGIFNSFSELIIYPGAGHTFPAFFKHIEQSLPQHWQTFTSCIYSKSVNISKTNLSVGTDSLFINTEYMNSISHNFSSKAIIQNSDSSLLDSVQLFDDGTHYDGQAGDGLWGNYFPPFNSEDEFEIILKSHDIDSQYTHIMPSAGYFTTIGPVQFQEYYFYSPDTIPNPGDKLQIKLILSNLGQTRSADSIAVQLVALDSCALIKGNNHINFGSVSAGGSAESRLPYTIKLADGCSHNQAARFALHIQSNYYTFWTDTFSIILTNLNQLENNTPYKFGLNQNYPNPFNPVTMISYQLPVTSHVKLFIYNTLGQQIQTLVSEKQNAGNHEIKWNASGLASGVYYYILKVGDHSKASGSAFVQTRKMILLR